MSYEYQDNKKSTDTSDIAPGAPIWFRAASGVHNNRDAGHGYSAQDPIPLSKGSYPGGSAITRFGKIGFKQSNNFVNTQHGDVIDFPIVREEGSQGEWTILIKQPDNSRQTGKMGSFNTAVEYGYDVCRVDVDLYTLNQGIPGVSFSTQTGELSVTFLNGETEKLLKMVVPYRTTVKNLKPDVLRQKVTYHVAEYIPYNFGKYRNNQQSKTWQSWGAPVRKKNQCMQFCSYYYCRYYSRTRTFSYDDNDKHWVGNDVLQYSIDHNNQTSENRWVWYKVYTLPLPRTWIENLAGNDVYINEYDTNYDYRQANNTCRGGVTRPDEMEPYRQDDSTSIDKPAEGIIARYDHNNKMQQVVGRSRLTSMYMHRFNHSGTTRGGKYSYYGCSSYCYGYRSRAGYLGQHHDKHGYWTPQTEHFISNDRRITHRLKPEYANATIHGVLYRPVLDNNDVEAYMFSINDTWQEAGNWQFVGGFGCGSGTSLHPRGGASFTRAGSQRPLSEYLKLKWNDSITWDTPHCDRKIYTTDTTDTQCWIDTNGSSTINISDSSALKSEVNYRPGSIYQVMYTMQTGFDQTKGGEISPKKDFNRDGTNMTNVQRSTPYDIAINSHDRASQLKYTMIPLNHTGWTREDFPGDAWFKTYNDRGLGFYPNDPGAVDNVGDGRVIEAYSYFLGTQTTAGKEFVKGLHPLTPQRFHEHDARIPWKNGIPPKWQSFYESTRYNNGENANTMHWASERQDARESRLPQNYLHHMSSDPTDKVFNYGNPINNVGDLAQVMFNHRGTETKDYVTGTSAGGLFNSYYTPTALPTEYFVMAHEDPSNIKHLYDGAGAEFETRHTETITTGIGQNQTSNHQLSHDQKRDIFLGGGSTYELTRPENWTDHWLTHSALCAGHLDKLDVPNTSNNFSGYKWDMNQLDTTQGSELATRGDGSAGHGEQGTSRVLYDMRDITHPLSSHDMNDKNLQAFYTCCVDHIDRIVDLQISKLVEDDPYNLGVIDSQINIVHTTLYDPNKHENYDYRIKGDSRIEIGATFATNDDWDGAPTAPSVTDRLFTPAGSRTDNPVVFLGFAPGVTPGGNPDNPVPEPKKRPALLRTNPLMTRMSFNVPTTVSSSTPYKTVRTFENVGEASLVLRLPYEFIPDVAEDFTDTTQMYKGDNPAMWSWMYVDVETGVEYPGLSRPIENRPGPSGLHNTVSLSAGEKIAIQYVLNNRSEQRVPYDGTQARINYCWDTNLDIITIASNSTNVGPLGTSTPGSTSVTALGAPASPDIVGVQQSYNAGVSVSTDASTRPTIWYEGDINTGAASAIAIRCPASRNFVSHQITIDKQGEDPIVRTFKLEAKYKD